MFVISLRHPHPTTPKVGNEKKKTKEINGKKSDHWSCACEVWKNTTTSRWQHINQISRIKVLQNKKSHLLKSLYAFTL